jgi:hypothetical protein
MVVSVVGNDPITAPEDELAALLELVDLLGAKATEDVGLIDVGGASSPLPATALRVLREAAEILARGEGAVVASIGPEVTPGQAAEVLALPRREMDKLLDEGTIPSREERGVRRIKLADLLAYRQVDDARRETAMTELVRISEELGLYEQDIPVPKRHG